MNTWPLAAPPLRPPRRLHPFCLAGGPVAALTLLLAASPAPAAQETINVSQVASGTAQHLPSSSLRTPCGSQCTWTTASGAVVSATFKVDPGNLSPAGWPSAWVAGKPAVADDMAALTVDPPTTGAMWTGFAEGPRHLAEVHYDLYPYMAGSRRTLSTENFRIGSGTAVVSYSVRISNPTAAAQAQWLEFTVPDGGPFFEPATNSFGGPSQFESITEDPDQAASRSTVDVLVDGLPVWTSATHLLRPQRMPGKKAPLFIKTGVPLNTDNRVTLFLGLMPPKAQTHVTVLLRTDARLLAPDCINENEYGQSWKRCHAHREQLSIPSTPSLANGQQMRPKIDVYLN